MSKDNDKGKSRYELGDDEDNWDLLVQDFREVKKRLDEINENLWWGGDTDWHDLLYRFNLYYANVLNDLKKTVEVDAMRELELYEGNKKIQQEEQSKAREIH